jgi:NB-ARC domain
MDDFTGREVVLSTIDRFLLPPSNDNDSGHSERLRSFAICGLGGMGKSEVAVEYAFTRKQHFEAIFWLNADDANILAGDFAGIAHELGLENGNQAEDLAASRELVNGWLSRPLRKCTEPDSLDNKVHWLLIFDNVDNEDALSEYWPKAGRGSVLVTSRDPRAKHNHYTKNGMDIPPLSKKESEDLIQKKTLIKANASQREALSAIADKLGGLPLAITHMASVIRNLRMESYSEFIEGYEKQGIKWLQRMQKTWTKAEKARSLVTCWALDTLSPRSTALLQVISLLDPDNIPEEILINSCGDVELDEYPKDSDDYIEARAELRETSLINRTAEKKQLSVHRLIQETAKGMMGQGRLFKVFRVAIKLVTSAWPDQDMKEHHSTARFSKCQQIFPSILRLKNGIEPFIREKSSFPLDIRMARLFNDAGW